MLPPHGLHRRGEPNYRGVPRTPGRRTQDVLMEGIAAIRTDAIASLLEGLSNYHTVRASTTGLALDEPVHDWSSHFGDSARVIAEAEAAGMLHSAGSTANVRRRPVTVRTGFRGDAGRIEVRHPRSVLRKATTDCARDSLSASTR